MVPWERMRVDGHKLKDKKIHTNIRKHVFIVRIVRTPEQVAQGGNEFSILEDTQNDTCFRAAGLGWPYLGRGLDWMTS